MILLIVIIISILCNILCIINLLINIVHTNNIAVDHRMFNNIQNRAKTSITPTEKKMSNIIWRIWCKSDNCGGRPFDKIPIQITKKYLPNWKHITFTHGVSEGDWSFAETWLNKNFDDPNILKAFKLLNPQYGAAKADFLRYALIYTYGGVYIDMKSCILSELPEIPKNKDMITCSWDNQTHLFDDGEYINWFLYCKSNAPIMYEILHTAKNNILDLHKFPFKKYQKNIGITSKNRWKINPKNLVLATTGPIMISNVINNSKHKNTVVVDQTLLSKLKYMCQNNDKMGKNHYSKAKGELVFPSKDAIYIPNNLYGLSPFEIAPYNLYNTFYTENEDSFLIKKFFPTFIKDYNIMNRMNKSILVNFIRLYPKWEMLVM